MVLKFELTNWKQFKSIIETTEKIMDEIIFTADNEGLRFSVLDRGHTSFFNSDFKNSYFDEFYLDDYETFGVDTKELLKVLKRGKSDDLMKVEVNNFKITIIFDGKSKRTFYINQIDIDYDAPTMPQIKHPVNEEISFKEFRDTIKDCELFDERFTIETKEHIITISNDGEFGGYSGEMITDSELENTTSHFAIEKISEVFKLAISDDMILQVGNDIPLILKWEDNFRMTASYMLAPRIKQD